LVVTSSNLDLIRRQAADWLARLQNENRSAADEAGFQRWLAQSDAHRATFDTLTSTWELAGALKSDDSLKPRRPVGLSRRAVLAGAAAGAVGLGWLAMGPKVYATGVGETKTIHLDDGSTILMDADSRIRVSLDSHQRRMTLVRGRAFFRSAADPARPFVVEAARQEVIGGGGDAFDVHLGGSAVSVVTVEGDVLVMIAGQPSSRVRASAGQKLVVGEGGSGRAMSIDVQNETAWRFGQAVFDDQTLADALTEMNRYSRRRLELGDPKLAGLRISGVYKAGDNEAFARSVAQLLDLKVRSAGSALVIESGQGV
jgi:transmembrane sensor